MYLATIIFLAIQLANHDGKLYYLLDELDK